MNTTEHAQTYVALNRSGRALCKGETITHRNGWPAIYRGLADVSEDSVLTEPTHILITWADDDRDDRRYQYRPDHFNLTIQQQVTTSNHAKDLAEAKLRIELARMTAELSVLPDTLPALEVSLTWHEAVALEAVIAKAIA